MQRLSGFQNGLIAVYARILAAANRVGLDELDRLQKAQKKAGLLGRTTRSRLPEAVDAVLRAPVLTARDLAVSLGISTQAALGLLRVLGDAGIVREATGRASWRAFTLI